MSENLVPVVFLGGIFSIVVVALIYGLQRSVKRYETLGKMIEKGCDLEQIRSIFFNANPYTRLLVAGIIIAGIGVGLILTGVASDVGIIKPPAEMLAPSDVPGSGYTPVRIDFGDYGPGIVFLSLGLSMILAWHLVRKRG